MKEHIAMFANFQELKKNVDYKAKTLTSCQRI